MRRQGGRGGGPLSKQQRARRGAARLTALPSNRLQLHARPADARGGVDDVGVRCVDGAHQRLEHTQRHPLAQALRAVLRGHGVGRP